MMARGLIQLVMEKKAQRNVMQMLTSQVTLPVMRCVNSVTKKQVSLQLKKRSTRSFVQKYESSHIQFGLTKIIDGECDKQNSKLVIEIVLCTFNLIILPFQSLYFV